MSRSRSLIVALALAAACTPDPDLLPALDCGPAAVAAPACDMGDGCCDRSCRDSSECPASLCAAASGGGRCVCPGGSESCRDRICVWPASAGDLK